MDKNIKKSPSELFWKYTSWLTGFIFLISILALLSNFGYPSLNILDSFHFNCNLVIIVVFDSILLVVSLHMWSSIVNSYLYKWVIDDQVELEECKDQYLKKEIRKKLGNRQCGYCGHKLAPLVCNRCESIQWADLRQLRLSQIANSKNLKITNSWGKELGHSDETPRQWELAAFVAHFRWRFIASVLSIVIVTLLSQGFELYSNLSWHMQNENTYHGTHAKKLVEAVAGMQKGFKQLELYCYESNNNNLWANTEETLCNKIYDDFLKHYYTLSWQVPILVKYLQEKKCNQPSSKMQKQVCRILKQDDIVSRFDKIFIGFTEHNRQYIHKRNNKSKTTNERNVTKEDIVTSMDRARCGLFSMACMIITTTFGPDYSLEKDFKSFDPCKNYLNIFDEEEIDACVSEIIETRRNAQ